MHDEAVGWGHGRSSRTRDGGGVSAVVPGTGHGFVRALELFEDCPEKYAARSPSRPPEVIVSRSVPLGGGCSSGLPSRLVLGARRGRWSRYLPHVAIEWVDPQGCSEAESTVDMGLLSAAQLAKHQRASCQIPLAQCQSRLAPSVLQRRPVARCRQRRPRTDSAPGGPPKRSSNPADLRAGSPLGSDD
jgi:hypothetical protein